LCDLLHRADILTVEDYTSMSLHLVLAEATRSIRQAEVGSTKTMLERVKARFDLPPERLIADAA
jgi:hypothetical protein